MKLAIPALAILALVSAAPKSAVETFDSPPDIGHPVTPIVPGISPSPKTLSPIKPGGTLPPHIVNPKTLSPIKPGGNLPPHIVGGNQGKPSKLSNLNPTKANGIIAEPKVVPYEAFLESHNSISYWQCGGSLISQNYVVTRASCVNGADYVHVTLGAFQHSAHEDTQVKLTSSDYKIHEDFTTTSTANNIAVIKLPQPVELTDAIQTISLPTDTNKDYVGSLATTSSWSEWNIDDVLNAAQVAVLKDQECQNAYQTTFSSGDLCSTAGLCSVVTGVPLVQDGQLIGVSNFNSLWCDGTPSVFVKVVDYVDWLKANTDV